MPLYTSLIDYTQSVRDNFEEYESTAKKLCDSPNYESTRRKFTPKSKDPDALNSAEVQLAPREIFITRIHYAICDSLISHLTMRKRPYEDLTEKFKCLFDLNINVSKDSAECLQKYYCSDLDENFLEELRQFSSLVDCKDSVADMLSKLKNFQLEDTFPNVETALRIFLTLPITNCTGERSFSVLKRLKSPLRSVLVQEKLSSLALLCNEAEITEKLEFEDVIKEFAQRKCRKKI